MNTSSRGSVTEGTMRWSLLRRELDGGRFYHRKTKNREREKEIQ